MKNNSENPYDDFGKDFLESYELIRKDYEDGKIKDINSKVIAYYSDKVPVENTMNMEITSAVNDAINNSDIETILSNSKEISDFSKRILLKSI